MGKKRTIFCIVFLPMLLFFYIIKFIYKWIEKRVIKRYIGHLDINSIDALSGTELEDFLYLFFKSLGLRVKKTKASHDYGADLIIKYKKQTILVQCKLYFKHSVGNSAIQEIATALDYYKADLGIVVTNSYFTKSAENLSSCAGVKLVDRNKLQELLSTKNTSKLKSILE